MRIYGALAAVNTIVITGASSGTVTAIAIAEDIAQVAITSIIYLSASFCSTVKSCPNIGSLLKHKQPAINEGSFIAGCSCHVAAFSFLGFDSFASYDNEWSKFQFLLFSLKFRQ